MAIQEIYDLPFFEAVQLSSVLADNKTFVDCIPKFGLDQIAREYEEQKDLQGFDLKQFVAGHFEMPPEYGSDHESDKEQSVEENIRQLWDVLTRKPSPEQSSLINLPTTYIVPGGRFREIYYWDSYFTMLGLQHHNRIDLVESMIDNFAFLLREYGHIPNGNRRYYLSRSQPPFFALMVTLLAGIKNDEAVFTKYLSELETEYGFWQKGGPESDKGQAKNRAVRMEGGELLNRYFDNNPQPRQESHAQDVHVSKESDQPPATLFTHLRAGAESGWDFSSRWFADEWNLRTIHTTDIVPVDLNCLLYTLELALAKASALGGNMNAAKEFAEKAGNRKAAIHKYCWNNDTGFFCDYNLQAQHKQQTRTAAGLFPLFVKIATAEQAGRVASTTEQYLLKPGGLVTTVKNTGQQWDAPNGWAPLQWVAYAGLHYYNELELANEIRERWLSLNERVFQQTGKLMEKYNVEDMDTPAGGGEYEGQDGFGWTNGIYVALKHQIVDFGPASLPVDY